MVTPADGHRDPFLLEDQIFNLAKRTHAAQKGNPDAGPKRATFLLLVAGRDCLLGARKDTETASSRAIRVKTMAKRGNAAIELSLGDRSLPDMTAVVGYLKGSPVEMNDVNSRYRYLAGLAVDATTNNSKVTGKGGVWPTADDFLADLVDVCLSGVSAADSDADRGFALDLVTQHSPSAVVTELVTRQALLGAVDDWWAAMTLLTGLAKTSDFLESRTSPIYRQAEHWERVYEYGLVKVGRRLRPGCTYAQLGRSVTALVDGASVRWYADRHSFPGETDQERQGAFLDWIVDGVMALLVGYTSGARRNRTLRAELDGAAAAS